MTTLTSSLFTPSSAKIKAEIVEREDTLSRLTTAHADAALAAFENEDDNAVSRLAEINKAIEAARARLNVLRAALNAAETHDREEAQRQRAALIAGQIDNHERMARRRQKEAAAVTEAITTLAKAWRRLVDTSLRMAVAYPGGIVPQGAVLNGAELRKVVHKELRRQCGSPTMGPLSIMPSLPGAEFDGRYGDIFDLMDQPSKETAISKAIADANAYISRTLRSTDWNPAATNMSAPAGIPAGDTPLDDATADDVDDVATEPLGETHTAAAIQVSIPTV